MKENKDRIILDVAYQPQVRTDKDTQSIMLDVIIALLPALAVAVWQYGIHPLLVVLVSVASAVFFEWGYRKLLKKTNTIGDLSACVTGMLLALTLPTSAPVWLPIVGSFFSIVVVKQLYGGIGKNFVNPALAGRAFLVGSYGTLMSLGSAWTAPASNINAITSATPLSYLYGEESMPAALSLKNVFFGIVPGCIGELSALALLVGFVYLLVRKVINWRIPVSFVGTVAIVTFITGKTGYTHFEYMLYNVCSGGLLLGAIFMATDYATSPVTLNGQLLFGFGCGAVTLLIRYFGGYPEGVTYAILIMNICAWAIDKAFHRQPFGTTKEDIADQKAKAKEAAK